MSCPDCGKTLAPNEILVPVFDKSGKELLFCFHVDEGIFRDFMAALVRMMALSQRTGMPLTFFIPITLMALSPMIAYDAVPGTGEKTRGEGR